MAAIAQVIFVVAVGAWNGLATPSLPSGISGSHAIAVTPGAVASLQGPFLVAVGGVLGIALSRGVPGALATSLTAAVAVYVLWPALLWWDWGWQRFLLPVAHDLRTTGTVDVGAGRSALIVRGSAPGALAWHVAYLAAWAVLLAAVTFVGKAPRRPAVLVASAALA